MGKRRITTEDLTRLRFVGDPIVSPTKEIVAYVLTEMSKEKDGYFSSIYLTTLDGENRQLTYHYDDTRLIKDTTPKWSPDGTTLTFLSNRTGRNQVWQLPVENGGEAKPLTSIAGNVVEQTWSPDGKQLALTVEENPEEEASSDVKVVTRLRYKADGTHDFLEKRKHIYLFNLETKKATKITNGDVDFLNVCFSPDGTHLLFVGSKEEDDELEYIPSIWKYDLTTEKETLFYKGKGAINSISYAPNGKWVAFIGHDKGENMAYGVHVWVISTETKETVNVSGSLDRSAETIVRTDIQYDTGAPSVVWDETSSSIYFVITDHGSVQLYQTTPEGSVSGPLTEDKHHITSFDLIDQQNAVLVQGHPESTGDVVLQSLEQVDAKKQLTNWNKHLYEEVEISTPEHFSFKSVDDLEIDGWFIKPIGHEDGKRSPLILQIHGGPHSSYGFGLQFEWQLMAAKGYCVLYMNPRGSRGYGQAFADEVLGDWAGKDYEDLMNGLDYVLEKHSFIDQDQLFVTGASYGGYMTNMITTKTNRFKAAITQNSVTNLYSMFGTSDIAFYFNRFELDVQDLWEDEEKIMKFSPIRYAPNVKTPMLILHNEKDYRCPMEQAEQWYLALRRLGVETKFIRFPEESHGLSAKGKPVHRQERLDYIIEWFEQYRTTTEK
ncbi:S9 family peptidase [Oceanobacillus halotolerans]|uniref:S9 family peptidase n=1 Tax=Oceanobacillus halotolerans TaxID=2663380 RepID=UPI0013DC5E8A|nr:S9 family peptidase [Oceanobacillus halotolerans]